jgi:hypothetical protein
MLLCFGTSCKCCGACTAVRHVFGLAGRVQTLLEGAADPDPAKYGLTSEEERQASGCQQVGPLLVLLSVLFVRFDRECLHSCNHCTLLQRSVLSRVRRVLGPRRYVSCSPCFACPCNAAGLISLGLSKSFTEDLI